MPPATRAKVAAAAWSLAPALADAASAVQGLLLPLVQYDSAHVGYGAAIAIVKILICSDCAALSAANSATTSLDTADSSVSKAISADVVDASCACRVV